MNSSVYNIQNINNAALSVSEVNRYIKMLMDNDILLSSVCVCGEISNLKKHSSGHFYFTLKDEESELPAVMFKYSVQSMRFSPENGMRVRAYGHVSTYEKNGKCQMYVSAMTDDGIGALQLEYERLRKKLSDEGLFSHERKRPLPKIPDCIGVITSPTGAAVRDIINITGRRWPYARILLYPSLVQGTDAPMSLCRGIELLNAYGGCDVIIIGRGGGSAEDLWAFNDERVVRTLASSSVPTISAVGHETDYTLCDFAADCRAPTPSAAAELAVPDKNEYSIRLDGVVEQIENNITRVFSAKSEAFLGLNKRLELLSPDVRLANERKMLDNSGKTIKRLMEDILRQKRETLAYASEKLALVNPLSVIGRGYSITKNLKGDVVSSVRAVHVGDEVRLILSDGNIRANVIDIEYND